MNERHLVIRPRHRSRFAELGRVLLALGCLVLIGTAHADGRSFYLQDPTDKSRPSDAARVWTSPAKVEWGKLGVRAGDTLIVRGPVTFRDSLRIAGSGTADAPIVVMCKPALSCRFDGEGQRFAGIDASDVKFVRVTGFVASRHTVAGIRFERSVSHVQIDGNETSDNKFFGIYVDTKDAQGGDIDIHGNHATRNGTSDPVLGGGIYVTARRNGAIDGVRIVDNDTSDNAGRYGISVYPVERGTVTHVEVSGNTCDRNGSSGIDFSKLVSDSTIEKNQCRDNGRALAGAAIHVGGVEGESVTRVVIRDNEASGQVFTSTDGAGVLVDDYTTNILVENNHVFDNQEAGVKLHNCKGGNTVRGNLVTGNGAGIVGDRAEGFVVESNRLLGNRDAGVLVVSNGGGSRINHNLIARSKVAFHVNTTNGPLDVRGNCIGQVDKGTSGWGVREQDLAGQIVDADSIARMSATATSGTQPCPAPTSP